MIMTYFLPMAMMSATYATIGRELWGHRAIGEATAVQRESIKSKRRVCYAKTYSIQLDFNITEDTFRF